MREPKSREDKIKLLKKIVKGYIKIEELQPTGEVWITRGEECYNSETKERLTLSLLRAKKNTIILLPDNYRDYE